MGSQRSGTPVTKGQKKRAREAFGAGGSTGKKKPAEEKSAK